MEVSVLFFAGLRDLTGTDACRLELEGRSIAPLSELIDRLHEHYPRLRMEGVRVAVNEEFVEWNSELRSGDTVALIPPVSGG